jgi:hypothetical protein
MVFSPLKVSGFKKKNPFFHFLFLSPFSFLSLLFPAFFYLTQEHLTGAPSTRTERPNHLVSSTVLCCSPYGAPFLLTPQPAATPTPCSSPPPSFPSSPASSYYWSSSSNSGHGRPFHGELQQMPFFFVGQPKRLCMTFLLLSPASILSETNSNLWILQDFVFKRNSDFISNSNFNPSRLLPHPYISFGAPPPRIPMPNSPQNRTIADTQAPSSLLVPLIAAISILILSYQIKPCVGHEKSKTKL